MPAWCECPNYIKIQGCLPQIVISKRIAGMAAKPFLFWRLGKQIIATISRELRLSVNVQSAQVSSCAVGESVPPENKALLEQLTQHIPDKSAQMIRYYGWCSNKMRGQRHMAANGGIAAEPLRPASTPPPPAKLPSRKWRDVILKVWHTDPLQCPHCQNRMRVIAVIEQAGVIE